MGKRREIHAGRVVIGGVIYEALGTSVLVMFGEEGLKLRTLTEINHELRNLESCDPFLPPDTDSPGCLEIVPVHDHMHSQVKRNRNP